MKTSARPARNPTWAARCWLGALIGIAITGGAAAQDSVEQFYRGRQISLVIGSSVGGGYDAYARLIAHHIARYIPGHPAIVPQNMPGAASGKLAYYINNVAPKDGTVVGAIFPGTIVDPLVGSMPHANYEASKLLYLGSANDDVFLCVARADAPVKAFRDAFTTPLTLGASDEGGSTRDFPAVLNNLLGTKFRVISGYAGSKEIALAVERGEVQGLCGVSWPSILAQHPDWIARHLVTVLAQENAKGHPDLNRKGVPLTVDFAKSAADRQAMELIYSQTTFGRPYVLPPGTPDDRVAALRQAFMAALHDAQLLAEASQRRLDIGAMPGEELQALVAKLYATPPEIVARAKAAMRPTP